MDYEKATQMKYETRKKPNKNRRKEVRDAGKTKNRD